jgi:hypothetical protein
MRFVVAPGFEYKEPSTIGNDRQRLTGWSQYIADRETRIAQNRCRQWQVNNTGPFTTSKSGSNKTCADPRPLTADEQKRDQTLALPHFASRVKQLSKENGYTQTSDAKREKFFCKTKHYTHRKTITNCEPSEWWRHTFVGMRKYYKGQDSSLETNRSKIAYASTNFRTWNEIHPQFSSRARYTACEFLCAVNLDKCDGYTPTLTPLQNNRWEYACVFYKISDHAKEKSEANLKNKLDVRLWESSGAHYNKKMNYLNSKAIHRMTIPLHSSRFLEFLPKNLDPETGKCKKQPAASARQRQLADLPKLSNAERMAFFHAVQQKAQKEDDEEGVATFIWLPCGPDRD